MPDSEFEKWTPKTSSTVRWLADKEQGLREEIDAELKASTKLVTAYDQNVLIISNGELFDGLAKANLRAHESWSDSKKLDHLVKAEAGWWFDVNGSSAEVIAGGIRVKTNVDLGGYLRGCLPDPDPKHWGDWVCRGFCLRLKTKDFGLEAIPTFQGDGLYFRFKLTNNARIEVDFCDMPDWPE